MKRFNWVAVLFLALAFALGSCAQLKERQLSDDVQTAVDVTKQICDTAEFFAAQGANIPGVEQCDRIVKVMSVDEIAVAVKILKCLDDYKPNEQPVAFTECAAKAGWPTLKKKLERLSKKLPVGS